MTHTELVRAAGRWLRGTAGCSMVLEELVATTSNGEQPDAIGWWCGKTLLVECKASRADFMADQKKRFRQRPERGMGQFRYFMAPEGLLRPEEMPPRWGLLEVLANSKIRRVSGLRPKSYADHSMWEFEDRAVSCETTMLLSALQRIKLQVGAEQFHSMTHTRIMREVVEQDSSQRQKLLASWAAAS